MATKPEHKPSIAPIVGPDDPRRFTDSGIEIKPVYGDDDVRPGLEERLGAPADYPFTRGIHPEMYRSRRWTMRQYAGYATAAETNTRYRYLLDGSRWENDWSADEYVPNGYGSDDSVLVI